MKQQYRPASRSASEFIGAFGELCGSRSAWQVWGDFIYCFAAAISNSIDFERRNERESRYLRTINQYAEKERMTLKHLTGVVTDALEDEPEQDFLGDLFMRLELGSHWLGQFFTPYNICSMMSNLVISSINEQIESHGFAQVNDPACGAGATLISYANAARKAGINYQQRVIFVGQDINQTTALMAYIQLSLLGCPGYIVVGDTMRSPIVAQSGTIIPAAMEGQELWVMPMTALAPAEITVDADKS